MAGGEGSRLRPLTVNRPKPLVPVGGRPIMDHIVRHLKSHGLTEIVSTLYYLSDEIESYFGDGSEFGVSMSYSLEDTPLGTAGSVKKAEDFLKESAFIIISGDALTNCDLTKAIEWHKQKGSMATLVLKRMPSPLDFGIVITREDGHIERFLEKPGWSEVFSDTVNTGIYIIEPEVLDLMEQGRSYDWSQDIFPKLLADGKPIYGYVMDEYWSDIGSLPQYREAQQDLLTGDAGLEVPGTLIRQGVWVGQGTTIEGSVEIIAPCAVGSDVRIKKGATIGPNTVLGNGVLVDESASISNSVLWEHCYVGQSAILEGALVGSRTTVKKDSVLRDGAVIGDQCLIDVGCVIKPDVKIWPSKVIERGSTVNLSLVTGNRWRGNLFRELGVAGLSNIEITPEFATRFGMAFGSVLKPGSRVIAARDSTRSSRMTKRSIIASLLSTGCTVIDMRSSPIPITRHHIRASGAAGGFSVRKFPGSTRMTLIEALDNSGAYVNQALQRKIESGFFREEFRRTDPDELGMIIVESHAADMYTHDFFECVKPLSSARRPRVVIDYGYSSISTIFPSILNRAGIEAIALNSLNDAKLAPRTPDDIKRHLATLSSIVASLNCDFGVLVTNEGERLTIVDDLGIPVTGHALLGLFSVLVAKTHENADIVLNFNAPDRLEEALTDMGAKVTRSRSTVRDMMNACMEPGVVFGGDEQGGFVFPTLTGGFDAMFALVNLVQMLETTGAKTSEIAQSLPEFHVLHETIPCPWEKKGTVMREIAERFRGSDQIELKEGLKIYFGRSWVLILPDSFEPAIHIYCEGENSKEALALLGNQIAQIDAIRDQG